jgi:hypothetical protein
MTLTKEQIAVTHVLELLRVVAHGAPDDASSAMAEFDRRLGLAGPAEADAMRFVRTVYGMATANALSTAFAAMKTAADGFTRRAGWFSGGDPSRVEAGG